MIVASEQASKYEAFVERLRAVTRTLQASGSLSSEAFYSEYKSFGGVRMPSKAATEADCAINSSRLTRASKATISEVFCPL